jgi:hypothetical protein
MNVVFLFPLAYGLFATIMIVVGDGGNLLKFIVASVYLSSVCIQFIPMLHEAIHFLVPMFMQVGLCLWYFVAGRFTD